MPLHTLPPLPHRDLSSRAAPVDLDAIDRELDSGLLLKGSREVLIRHAGQVYRLRHTRNDKLILTK
ncbi:hemin uptake protein HemP [Coralloluteibacterium stylophorae]|uniref:Hemin uptake protein HemP n=1 Tax=Coralloluteibacterium stylophorae TaxID=1776034 RepID=A0A8J7VV44_9GAMM|nr:hemin uptake protein HemP [Coralloluteibacterium stylophorae]MBS7456048.1 hemin uptake protein HemP [Coralloluteibacterium stylophorae]